MDIVLEKMIDMLLEKYDKEICVEARRYLAERHINNYINDREYTYYTWRLNFLCQSNRKDKPDELRHYVEVDKSGEVKKLT